MPLRKRIHRGPLASAGLILLLCVLCSAQVNGAVVAEVNGTPITDEELAKALNGPLPNVEEQAYRLKRDELRAMIDARLMADEAARRGVTVVQLFNAEVIQKTPKVTDQEAEKFYQDNRAKYPNLEHAVALERARATLLTTRIAKTRGAYIETLRSRAKIVVHLARPPVVRAQVPISGGIQRGRANAPVTIVEFTDFGCPYCKRLRPTFDELFRKFGDKLRYVHHDFPIESLHHGASRAHIAARCANDQGKFWSYRDFLFEGAGYDNHELRAYATQAKLNLAKFDRCIAGNAHLADVNKEIETGRALGITATPTVFINGRMVVGAKPLSAFIAIVEEELARPSK